MLECIWSTVQSVALICALNSTWTESNVTSCMWSLSFQFYTADLDKTYTYFENRCVPVTKRYTGIPTNKRSICSCVRLHIEQHMTKVVSPLHDMQLLLSRVECDGANTHYQPAPPQTHPQKKKKSQWYFLIYCFERICVAGRGSGSRLRNEQSCCCQTASHGRRAPLVRFGPYYSVIHVTLLHKMCSVCVHKHTTFTATHTQSH